VNINKKTEISS